MYSIDDTAALRSVFHLIESVFAFLLVNATIDSKRNPPTDAPYSCIDTATTNMLHNARDVFHIYAALVSKFQYPIHG